MSAFVANAYTNALDAYASAIAAAGSALAAANSKSAAESLVALAGATNWVSGENFNAAGGASPRVGDARISLIDRQSYRRNTVGSGTTDPKNDPTNWTRVIVGAGSGGEIAATGSVVLTNISGAAQTLSPTGYGQSVTLPNATTCTVGGYFFNLYNNGPFAMRVLDFAGATQGFIAPYSGAVLALSSTATAAGVWNFTELLPYAVTAATNFPTAGFSIAGAPVRVVLDATRTMLIFSASNSNLYGVIFDAASGAWGALTLIRASGTSAGYTAILSATNQVLVCSCASGGTAFEAVTLTTSGTGIAPNTPAPINLVGNFGAFGDLIAVGTSWVLGYSRATSIGCIRAITISGTAVTVGAEVALPGVSAPHLYAVTSGVVLAINAIASGAVFATPYTVSGSSLAVGTGAIIASNSANVGGFRSFPVGSRWGIVFNGTSEFVSAAIVSVSTTVATASTLQNVLSSTTDAVSTTTEVVVSGSKFALVCGSASQGLCINVITDTAGTASKGTALAYGGYTLSTNCTVITRLSGSSATVVASTNASTLCYSFDISGASPALQSSQIMRAGSSQVARPASSSPRGLRAGNWLKGATLGYAIASDSTFAMAIGANMLERFHIPAQLLDTSFVPGADNQSICYTISGPPAFQFVEGVV